MLLTWYDKSAVGADSRKRGVFVLRKILCLLLILFGLALPSTEAAKTELTNIRWSVHNNKEDGSRMIRMVIDATAPVKVATDYVDGETPQLKVTVSGAIPRAGLGNVTLKSDLIKGAVVNRAPYNGSQLSISLNRSLNPTEYKVFVLKKDLQNNKPDRVVVDLYEIPVVKFSVSPGLKGKTIVIDPGHGGSDPGAIGPSRIYEKKVTLAISQRVEAILKQKGANVVLTREDDRDVYPSSDATDAQELQARVDVGVKEQADVFISIHANASVDRTVSGTATYYTPKTSYDLCLARALQSNIMDAVGLTNGGIRQAGFYVTKRSRIPAALIETAFISNPTEEQLLNSPVFQQKMAVGIADGVEDYFSKAAGGDN